MTVATFSSLETDQLCLGPDAAGCLVSAAEFANAEFKEPFQYERVRGRLVVLNAAGAEQRFVSRPFRRTLSAYWAEHLSLVEDVDVKGWVITSPDNDRLPEICVYLVGDDAQRRIPDRVPALVFEFVSQCRSDQERVYIHKRDEYHAIGVKEYVIIDRFKRAVLVLTWQPDGCSERTLTEHDFYSTSLLPDLVIPLSEAFAQPTE